MTTLDKTYRIAIVHNKVMPYRRPFFGLISERHDVDFLIFEEQESPAEKIDVDSVGRRGLFNRLRKEQYDIVLAPDIIFKEAWITIVTSWLDDTPVILWSETWDWPNRKSHQKLKTAGLFRVLDYGINGYIVPGNRSKEFILEHTSADSMDIRRVPNASHINKNEHGAGLTKSDIGIPDDEKVVLFLGELSERKGVHTLLRACSLLEQERDDFTMLVCGTGDSEYTERVKTLSDNLGLESVMFYGWVDEAEIYDVYSLADIYALLSTYDPFPLSVVEAMNAGTPAVVSNGVGEAYDLIRDGETGYVVRTGTPRDAANAIDELLAQDEERQEMANKCRKYIKKQFTYREMISRLERMIYHVNQNKLRL